MQSLNPIQTKQHSSAKPPPKPHPMPVSTTNPANLFSQLHQHLEGETNIIENIPKLDIPLEYFFQWIHTVQERQPKIAAPLIHHFQYEVDFFLHLLKPKCCNSFSCVFTKVVGIPPTSFEKLCPRGGQHFESFLVGCNQKSLCKGSVAKKLARGSQFKRPSPTPTNCQLARLFDHLKSKDRIARLGRHENKGSRIGNQKFQLLE